LTGDCPFKRTENDAPASPALLAPPGRRNPGPTGRGAPLSPSSMPLIKPREEQELEQAAGAANLTI